MKLPSISWSNIGLILFILYIANSVNVFYTLYYPRMCNEDSRTCFSAMFDDEQLYDLHVVASLNSYNLQAEDIIFSKKNVKLSAGFEETVNINLNKKFLKNNTVHGHVVVVRAGNNPMSQKTSGHYATLLTSYKVPEVVRVNLMEAVKAVDNSSTISHWKPRLTAHILDPDIKFDGQDYPGEFRRIMNKQSMTYKPVIYVDQLSHTRRHDTPLLSGSVNLTISFSPITIGKLRIWMQFEEALLNLKALGFGEDDVDEIKGIFTDTNMYFLTLTFFVTVFHLLFDFLAFKNDINFWKNRKNTVGLSTRVIIWRCVSQIIIFLYLCEHKTSYIVLGPAGVGMFIELWKVCKSLKFSFSGGKLQFGEKTEEEKLTEKIDSEAMWYLQWLMYPLVIGGAVYSLLYVSHRSWLVLSFFFLKFLPPPHCLIALVIVLQYYIFLDFRIVNYILFYYKYKFSGIVGLSTV